MYDLTQRQQAVLAFIVAYRAEHGYPPTLREIGAHMGIASTNGVADHLRALERKGRIRQTDMVSRGIVVLGESGEPLPQPVIRADAPVPDLPAALPNGSGGPPREPRPQRRRRTGVDIVQLHDDVEALKQRLADACATYGKPPAPAPTPPEPPAPGVPEAAVTELLDRLSTVEGELAVARSYLAEARADRDAARAALAATGPRSTEANGDQPVVVSLTLPPLEQAVAHVEALFTLPLPASALALARALARTLTPTRTPAS